MNSPLPHSSIDPSATGITEANSVTLPHPLSLDCGEVLRDVVVAYEAYGTLSPARDNVVLVCHALSGDAHAAGIGLNLPSAVDGFGAQERGIAPRGGVGWWDVLIGPGRAFDTDRYYVICSNIIGSCRGSTGPASIRPGGSDPYATDFPVVTVADMVRAQAALIDLLGIDSLLAVAGGSLGGMQALEWAISYPERVRGCIMTASTARLGTQGVALNAIARNAIMADPDWQGGHYYGTGRSPDAGIGVARMVGHVTYLSAEALTEKFGRRLQERDQYSYTLKTPDFAVESYLRYQAVNFAGRFDANSYLYISRALTYFDPAMAYGEGELSRALRSASATFLLLSFTSDWIYPTRDSVELEVAIREAGGKVERHEIETTYGHDSFLLEDQEQTKYISRFLQTLHSPDFVTP